MSSPTYVEYSIVNGRAEIAMNRPDVLNAFNVPMLDELNETLADAMDESSVYAIVLTGKGRGFCSGADVTAMEGREDRETPLAYRAYLDKIQNVVRHLYEGRTPTIAAVNGPAVGVGCDFALACDLRVMSESAFMRQQFVNLGLVPGDGGGWLLPRLIGESKAKEYLLTGKDITPEDALDDGLVMEVTDEGAALDAARETASDIVSKPRKGVEGIKSIIDVRQSFEEHARAAFEAQWECINDPEHYEAVNALLEGREPELERNL